MSHWTLPVVLTSLSWTSQTALCESTIVAGGTVQLGGARVCSDQLKRNSIYVASQKLCKLW